jgi:ABC-type phosphate transport system substrate-binding protein
MRRRICKSSRARIVAFAIAAGVLGSLAAAPASMAANPPSFGANCQPDGKISGAGSTFQTNAILSAFSLGYQNDVCGAQPNVSGLNSLYNGTDPSIFTVVGSSTTVSGMVGYNYTDGTATPNGSGAGLNHISCRTDMFGGTDLPYNAAQLTNVNGAPGAQAGGAASCPTALNTAVVPPPYGPQPAGTYPATGDTARAAMNFPTAGGAVAYAVNLNGVCPTPPTGINLTAWEFDRIMQGTINQWNDANLVATNPSLSTCSGPIKRVVRRDNSGTTAITMFTLFGGKAGALDNGVLCGSENATHNNHTWIQIATLAANNANWPVANGTSPDCVDANGNPAQATVVPANTGSPAVISTLDGTVGTDGTLGGIGYAELGLWPNPLPPGVSFVNLQTHDDFTTPGNGNGVTNPGVDSNGQPAFQSPGSPGGASHCTISATPPTGSTGNAMVGLLATNWRNDPTGPQDANIAFAGAGYPGCGLTFDFVYSGLHNAQSNEVAGFAAPNFTPGCQISGTALATTANGAQTVAAGGTLATNGPLTSWPATGTVSVDGTTQTYTGKSGNSLTGVNPGLTVASGDAITLVSTKSAATASTVGITGACQTTTGATSTITPEVGLTNDQMRTLYSYMTYVLSPLGQANLASQTYDQLPGAWLGLEVAGFQNNF